MKKKTILLLISIMALSGCTINYDINLTKELKVEEKINTIGDSRFNMTSNWTTDQMYNIILDTYSAYLDKSKINNVEKYLDNNNLSIKINNNYDDLKTWAESYYLKKLYPNVNITENDNIITIATDNTLDNLWVFMPDMEDSALIEKLKINIKVPYVVTNSNADSVDEKNNIYTWNYNFQTTNKIINLSFDKNNIFVEKSIFLTILKILGITIGIIIIIYVIYKHLLKNKQKNNKV